MERRLILHENLKTSKQKKMKIKQGDVLVTLNLKTDLIDPKVEISDKVLFMLEAFAEKHQANQKAISTETTKPETVKPPLKELETCPKTSTTLITSPAKSLVSSIKIRDKVILSPSKRVRFDLESTDSNSKVPKLDTQIQINNEATAEQVLAVPESLENSLNTVSDSPTTSEKAGYL